MNDDPATFAFPAFTSIGLMLTVRDVGDVLRLAMR